MTDGELPAGGDAAAPTDDEQESVSELLDELGRDVRALLRAEAAAAAAEHSAEIRRGSRDVAAALAAGLALLTAFLLANWAAVRALEEVASGWRAPLLLAAGWLAVAVVLAALLAGSARRTLGHGDGTSPVQARADAQEQVRSTLKRLAAALAGEAETRIAGAVVPIPDGVVEVGEEILETAGETVEEIVDEIPGGGVAEQVIDLVLMPGRFGVRIVTSAFRRPP
jgi:hypothetical protein